jgi:hypothetical protein
MIAGSLRKPETLFRIKKNITPRSLERHPEKFSESQIFERGLNQTPVALCVKIVYQL